MALKRAELTTFLSKVNMKANSKDMFKFNLEIAVLVSGKEMYI